MRAPAGANRHTLSYIYGGAGGAGGMASKMISVRLPPAVLDAVQGRAAKAHKTQSQAVVDLLGDALDTRGRTGIEARLAAAEATIAEQERMLQRHGKRTPRRKRVSCGLTLAEAAALDRAARQAGMTRGEFLRARIVGGADGTQRRALPSGAVPALADTTAGA